MSDPSVECMDHHILSDDHNGIFHFAIVHIGHTLYDNCKESDLKGWPYGENTAQQTGIKFQSAQTGRLDARRGRPIIFHLSTAISHIHTVDYNCHAGNGRGLRCGELLHLPIFQSCHVVSKFGRQSNSIQFNVVEVSQRISKAMLRLFVVSSSATGRTWPLGHHEQYNDHNHDHHHDVQF